MTTTANKWELWGFQLLCFTLFNGNYIAFILQTAVMESQLLVVNVLSATRTSVRRFPRGGTAESLKKKDGTKDEEGVANFTREQKMNQC